MLRWLAGGGANSSAGGSSAAGGGGSAAGSDFVGKVVRVESHQLTVEEVIAEGELASALVLVVMVVPSVHENK